MPVYLPGGVGSGLGGDQASMVGAGFAGLNSAMSQGLGLGERIANIEARRRQEERMLEDRRLGTLQGGGSGGAASANSKASGASSLDSGVSTQQLRQYSAQRADEHEAAKLAWAAMQEEQAARAAAAMPSAHLAPVDQQYQGHALALRDPYAEPAPVQPQAHDDRLAAEEELGLLRGQGGRVDSNTFTRTEGGGPGAYDRTVDGVNVLDDPTQGTATQFGEAAGPTLAAQGGFALPPTSEELQQQIADSEAALNPAMRYDLPPDFSGSVQEFGAHLSEHPVFKQMSVEQRARAEGDYLRYRNQGVRELAQANAEAERRRQAALRDSVAAIVLTKGGSEEMVGALFNDPKLLDQFISEYGLDSRSESDRAGRLDVARSNNAAEQAKERRMGDELQFRMDAVERGLLEQAEAAQEEEQRLLDRQNAADADAREARQRAASGRAQAAERASVMGGQDAARRVSEAEGQIAKLESRKPARISGMAGRNSERIRQESLAAAREELRAAEAHQEKFSKDARRSADEARALEKKAKGDKGPPPRRAAPIDREGMRIRARGLGAAGEGAAPPSAAEEAAASLLGHTRDLDKIDARGAANQFQFGGAGGNRRAGGLGQPPQVSSQQPQAGRTRATAEEIDTDEEFARLPVGYYYIDAQTGLIGQKKR